jgi:hypothetical protein
VENYGVAGQVIDDNIIWRMRFAFCITKAGTLPEFAGSNPAEAVGFFSWKNSQHAFLRRGSQIICPMSQLWGM